MYGNVPAASKVRVTVPAGATRPQSGTPVNVTVCVVWPPLVHVTEPPTVVVICAGPNEKSAIATDTPGLPEHAVAAGVAAPMVPGARVGAPPPPHDAKASSA